MTSQGNSHPDPESEKLFKAMTQFLQQISGIEYKSEKKSQ